MNLTFSQFLSEGYDMKSLKAKKVALTDEERKAVIDAGAVWHMGKDGTPTPAVWKSKNSKGEFVYVCNTHRAAAVEKTLKAAIKAFDFIETTS